MDFPYEMIEVRDDLKPFVCRYIYMNFEIDQPFDIEVMTSGHTFFYNCFARNIPRSEYRFTDRVVIGEGRWNLLGQVLNDELRFYEPSTLKYITAELEPTAPHRLFGLKGSEFARDVVSLSRFAPDLLPLAKKCFVADETASKEEHIREFDTFLGELAAHAPEGDRLVEDAVALLKSHNGALSISDLCEELGESVRTLNRRFDSVVGLSPKVYAKTLQINWALGLMLSGDAQSLTDIALKAGFSDQAHFSNAMKSFFKQSPKAFLESKHVELSTFFNEMNRDGPVIVQALLDN